MHSFCNFFSDSIIENINAEYGGLLYIERNNVEVNLYGIKDMNGITVTGEGGSLIDWICQSKNSDIDSDICGDLHIFNSKFDSFESNIITVDLSSDPSQIAFDLNVDTSNFTNNIGSVFNFNSQNENVANSLEPLLTTIQQRNMFVTIANSIFINNDNQMDEKGTIFTINSATVPNITISDSVYRNNTGYNGAIFYWHCSRIVHTAHDNYCGQISLQNSKFEQNKIAQNMDNNIDTARYGSIVYGSMSDSLYFNFMMEGNEFVQQEGNLMYFEALDPIDCTTFGNNTSGCTTTNSSSPFLSVNSNDTDPSDSITRNINGTVTNIISLSWIFIDDCKFTNNYDEQYAAEGSAAILKVAGLQDVFTTIDRSEFVGQRGGHGAVIFLMDYAPLISISNSVFNDNFGGSSVES